MDNQCTRLLFLTVTNRNWKDPARASHIILKASKVDETWVGKISRFIVIDAEEEVQGESGDHGGKELQTEQTTTKNDKKFCLKWGQRAHTKQCHLLSSTSASGSRKRLPPPERTELPLCRKKTKKFYKPVCKQSINE